MINLLHIKNGSSLSAATLVCHDSTYSVLYSILHRNCEHIFTNNSSIIICHSNPPYPVWVWCKDPSNLEDIVSISNILSKYFSISKGYNVIISDKTLSALSNVNREFSEFTIKMELFSYRLDNIKDIEYNYNGSISLAKLEEVDELASIWHDACLEMELIDFDIEFCKKEVIEKIKNNSLFCLKLGNGEIAALTGKDTVGEYSKISTVYTLPHLRRNGYAINLVHFVTKTILEDNLIPILYTDGNYNASNECYKKIGYYQVGRLLNIQK